MIEKIALRIFWTMMLLCAASALTIVWSPDEPAVIQARITMTLFILGFASFLIWVPHVVYRFLKAS